MTRTLLIRLLLSLLLLLSQQMGMVHAMSHWAGAAQAQVDGEREGELAKAVATHPSCDKCLAFAQIAGTVGNLPRSFAGADAAAIDVSAAAKRPVAARSIAAFHSRGPPSLT